jgi:hypothetical protein
VTTIPVDDTAVILARIETKLDTALTEVADHEQRLRRLERALWVATGAAAAGGGSIGALVVSALGLG